MIDFDAWAETYDRTRGVSPSVLGPVLEALGPAVGRSLLDVGGGTGSFAQALAERGFAVTMCDVSPAMARHARTRVPGQRVLVADAGALPFTEAAFDCAISINVLRHLPDPVAALREARRVLRDGPLVLKVSTTETNLSNWLLEYFPTLLAHQPPYQSEAEIRDELRAGGFARVEVRRFVYTDTIDGSFQALKHDPDALLDHDAVMNTAVFQRLPRRDLEAGLEAIRRDRLARRLREVIAEYEAARQRYGDGSIFVARP